MAERTTVTQTVQIGVETTPGTAVAANRLLQSVGISPSVSADVDVFRPSGYKYSTVAALGREFVEADVEGQPTYSELIYPLASVLKYAAPVQQGGTPAYKWTFDPSSTAEDAIKTYTIEQGDGRAHRFTNGIFTGFSLDFSRDDVSVGGAVLGKAIEDGVVKTASPTAIELQPILPKEITVYLDETSAGLGVTKLSRVLSGSWSISDRFGALWVVDRAQASFAATVEIVPTLEVALTVEADANGMDLLERLRDGATRFMRIEAVGPVISGAEVYKMNIDTAVKVTDVGDFADEDGVFAIDFTFTGVHDATWGRATRVELWNKQTAL